MKYLALFALSFLTACADDDDDLTRPACGPDIEIIAGETLTSVDNFTVISADLDDRCLTLVIEATGCSTDTWNTRLITRGEVAESLPTQTSAYLLFDDGIDNTAAICQAQLRDTLSFDISPYLPEDAQDSNLTITGLDAAVEVR